MKTKRNYQVPSIKVVAFKVEDAFTSVGLDANNLGAEDLQIQEDWYQR